jgi:ankyrin repeat protein
LEQYWNKTIEYPNQELLRNFAEELLSRSSNAFSDNDRQFTGIPSQIMMLGEAFVKEAENYCLSGEVNLPENINLLALFRKFTEKKCDIYFKEKYRINSSTPLAKMGINVYIKEHIILALMSLFSRDELEQLLNVQRTCYMEHMEEFVESGAAEEFGLITEITDNKPRFIHRYFAEYFAAKWFTKNFTNCGSFISESLLNSTYEVILNFFDRMLAKEFKLHDAVLNNDLNAVTKVLKEETDVNCVDKGGRTALHLAASHNSIITNTLLSVPGVNTNITDGVLKWTPLRYAYTTRSWMAMDSLLQIGGNGDDIVLTRCRIDHSEWGQAALWESAQKGHKNLLEFMLNSGFDVNAVVGVRENDQDKFTLIHIATQYSQEEVVRFLIERNAVINIRSFNSNTALHVAAQKDNVDIITLLLDKGASVNVRGADGRTPVHHAAYCGNLSVTKLLVQREASLEKTDNMGRTPLMLAALADKLEVVRYLAKTGAGINVCSDTGSDLHLAINEIPLYAMCLLREQVDDINGRNAELGMSPLHFAILRQNLEIVKYLIERGADINLCTREGRNRSPLHLAVLSGNLEILDCLIEAGANLNAQDRNGRTVVHNAVASNNTALALHLVEKGADVNIPDFERQTPLHLSVLHNNVICAKHFVKFGAIINCQIRKNITALSVAIMLGRIHIVNILVENGADINLRDDFGNTALHFAIRKGDPVIIHYLIDRGADINIPNNERDSPMHWITSLQWKILADHLEIDMKLEEELLLQLQR